VPPDLYAAMREAMKRPEGTLQFKYTSAEVFGIGDASGIILQLVAGGHIFRLERSADRILHFFYSSPGTGTRVASVALGGVPAFERALLYLTWSPAQIRLDCGPLTEGGKLISAEGVPSARRFRVGDDGSVIAIGDEGVEVLDVRVFQVGRSVLQPTAIEAWEATLKAIAVLWTGQSSEGYLFEAVLSSATLTILVTGMEAYAGTRLLELESEGIVPNVDLLFNALSSRSQREGGGLAELLKDAAAANVTPLNCLISRGSINFQNYENVKSAFARAYGIKLGEIGVASEILDRLQRLIRYRHRVVHVSPMIGILNNSDVPPEKPEFTNRALAMEALDCFNHVIRQLHLSTLSLRPTA
jgi:hypothetical protein